MKGDINLRPSSAFDLVADGKQDHEGWDDDDAGNDDDGNVAANLILVIRLWEEEMLASARAHRHTGHFEAWPGKPLLIINKHNKYGQRNCCKLFRPYQLQ